MIPLHRRVFLAAGATLASALAARKLWAARKPWAAVPDGMAVREETIRSEAGALPADFRFTLADGTVRTIGDYAGKGVVLNLWATWCVPCVAEMPALDALAAAVRSSGVVVLPISSDRGGAVAVERFYRQHEVKNLPVVLDPMGAGARMLGARGIPTTLLIDARGMERGRMEGGADWDSPATIAMIRKLANA